MYASPKAVRTNSARASGGFWTRACVCWVGAKWVARSNFKDLFICRRAGCLCPKTTRFEVVCTSKTNAFVTFNRTQTTLEVSNIYQSVWGGATWYLWQIFHVLCGSVWLLWWCLSRLNRIVMFVRERLWSLWGLWVASDRKSRCLWF